MLALVRFWLDRNGFKPDRKRPVVHLLAPEDEYALDVFPKPLNPKLIMSSYMGTRVH